MTKPNLSFQTFASTLAGLATIGALVACGGNAAQQQPANAPVSGTEVSATPAKAGGHASCSAAGCGAKKEEAATPAAAAPKGQASCSAAGCGASKTAGAATTDEAKKDAPSTTAASTTPAAATPAASSSAKTPPKPPAAAAAKPKTGGGASCGAGTCSAKK